MEAQQQFDKIEAYLAGELTGSALSTLKQKIQTDATFAAIVEEHRIAHNAIEVLVEDDLRKELDLLRAEATTTASTPVKVMQMQTTGRRRSLFPRLAAAASVVLLIGFFTLQYNTSSTNILDQHYTEYQMPEINRSGEATDLHPLAEGLYAYKADNYAGAIRFYQNIPAADKRYNEAQFYLGHSLYQNKEYAKASTTFERLVQSEDIRFLDKAEWYQLLSLIANKQQDEQFTTLLNKILNDKGHPNYKQAQALKADL